MENYILHMKMYIQPLREIKDLVKWVYKENNKEFIEGMARVVQRDQFDQYEYSIRKIEEINYKQ